VDSALWAADKYIELAPDEANPYDSRADICAAHGLIDEAKTHYRKALEVKPDFAHSLLALGDLCLLTYEYAAADSCYRKLAVDSPDAQERSLARYYLALIPLMKGKLGEAIRLLNDCIAGDRVDDIEDEQLYKYRLRGLIQYDRRQFEQALASMDTAYQITRRVDVPGGEMLRSYRAKILAAAGRIREAEEIIAELAPVAEDNGDSSLVYLYAAGALALHQGNAPTAIALLQKAATIRECFPPHYLLAQAYLLAGRSAEAAELLEDQLKVYSSWHVSAGHWHVKMHYLLALAYEGLEKYQLAIQEYETFLEIWVGADDEIPELDAARRSLKRLTQSP
jgi:tetratricopeptide (TPR) repeat protein